MKQESKTIRQRALNFLARREHGRRELHLKLTQHAEEDIAAIDTILDDLEACGWQSDIRFASNYLYARANRGFGPLRIEQELLQRGVDPAIITQAFADSSLDWLALAQAARIKRFGREEPRQFADKVKQHKFLQYRGFKNENQ